MPDSMIQSYVERINRELAVNHHGFRFGGTYVECKDVVLYHAPKDSELAIRLKDGRIVHEVLKDKKEAYDRMNDIMEWCAK